MAYESDESGRPEIYVDAFPEARNKVRISAGGGEFPEWSPDGRELFYLSPDLKLMQVSLKRGPDSIEPSAPRELFALPVANDGYCPYEVAPDGQRFLVRATPEKQAGQPLTLIVFFQANDGECNLSSEHTLTTLTNSAVVQYLENTKSKQPSSTSHPVPRRRPYALSF